MNDADTSIYRIVVNHEEQYSIWPADRELHPGWCDEGTSASKDCLNHIETIWTDMRPLSCAKPWIRPVRLRAHDRGKALAGPLGARAVGNRVSMGMENRRMPGWPVASMALSVISGLCVACTGAGRSPGCSDLVTPGSLVVSSGNVDCRQTSYSSSQGRPSVELRAGRPDQSGDPTSQAQEVSLVIRRSDGDPAAAAS